MLSGVPGQALLMYLPPPEVQDEVEMQTPRAPPEPVQAPLTTERSARASTGWSSARAVRLFRASNSAGASRSGRTWLWMVAAAPSKRRMVGRWEEKCIVILAER